MSNSKQTPFQRCLALICLGVLLTVAGCTAPSATTSPTTEADATTTTTTAESAPQAGSETAPETAAKEPPARRFIPAPKAPRMSEPMPPERMPSPVTLDYSCRADADCAVKNVGNCCGMMPACVNKDSPTDPAAVQAECASKGLSSVCGFREISACSCVDSRCQAQSSLGARSTLMLRAQVRLSLPEWVHEFVDQADACVSDGDKVAFAIELSRRNIHAQTGGPFGAAVYGPDDHLVSVGVNRVLPQSTSVAHAEMMAYLLAQQGMGRARLNERADGSHFGPYTLATSAQPCCQCYGATIWAGIDRLLIGARSEDVESLTEFDEGPLPQDWIGELGKRGIAVVRDLHRDTARAVLSEYGSHGGKRY